MCRASPWRSPLIGVPPQQAARDGLKHPHGVGSPHRGHDGGIASVQDADGQCAVEDGSRSAEGLAVHGVIMPAPKFRASGPRASEPRASDPRASDPPSPEQCYHNRSVSAPASSVRRVACSRMDAAGHELTRATGGAAPRRQRRFMCRLWMVVGSALRSGRTRWVDSAA
jgi:hypothetical protein